MESFVPTQSLQKIFTPVISQITELLIVTSDKYQADHQSETANKLLPLVSMSEDIVNTLKDLTTVCKQTVDLEYSSDKIAVQKVDHASQNVLVSGESLVLCCHILCSSPKANFQLKTPIPHQTDVTTCLSDLNEHVLHLLLSVDDAEVRKIANFGYATTEALVLLTTADRVQVLADYFRTFAVPAANLHISASARCQDLLDTKIQYNLKCSLTTLRQSLPMLTAALQMAIKYDDNAEVLKGRDFCVEQVRKAIADIIRLITTKHKKRHFMPETNVGLFVEKISIIEKMLSPKNRKELDLIALNMSIETFIHHSMELSLVLSKSSSPLELKGNAVVNSCRKLMRSLRELEKVDGDLKHQESPSKELRDSYDEKCTRLRSVAQGVKATVIHAATALVTHAFRFTDEPLNAIVDACVPPTMIADDDSENLEEQRKMETEKQEQLSNSFLQHFESLSLAARFAASCCPHDITYQKYFKILMSLDLTSKAIPPAAAEYTPEKQEEESDLMRFDKLLDLQEKWSEILIELIQVIVASLDLKGLLEVLVEEIYGCLEKCNEGIVNLDESQIARHLQNVTGKSRLLVHVATAVVACSDDPVFRNGILVHVKELKQNISNNIARGNQIIEDVARIDEQEVFLNSATCLKESIRSLVNALLSDGNQPDLTSLDRFYARENDSTHTHAMLKEMHSLNETLAALGFDPITDEEANISLPEPSTIEAKWPRYNYYKKHDTEMHNGDVSPRETEFVQEHPLPELESLPEKIHPIIENLLQFVKQSHESKFTKFSLENVKKQIQRATEICIDIGKDALGEMQPDEMKDYQLSIQKASARIQNICELILKEVEEISSKSPDDQEVEALCLLGLQWSRALYIISIGCIRIQPLYVVPVRRYLALSLDEDIEDVHSIARYIVSYPGSTSEFLSKMSAFKEDIYKHDNDCSGIGDFNVHEQNVNELIQLANSMYHVIASNPEDGDARLEKEDEIVGLFEVINFDWSSACKVKLEILECVNEVTSPEIEGNDVNKAFLQLLCLSWSYKVFTLHSSIIKASRLIMENFDAEICDFPMLDMISDPERSTNKEIKFYRQQIFTFIAKQFDATNSTPLKNSPLISTWNENLKVTGDVIEDILEFLCCASSSVPLVHHHGHSMFHLIYLHHLFFLELSFLEISMAQPEEIRDSTAEDLDTPRAEEKRPSLSSRLRALKEERERRDESLHDLLTKIPSSRVLVKK